MRKLFVLLVLLLVSLDILSKVVVKTLFMDLTFSMFNGILTFRPFLNTNSMSLFNGLMFDLNISLKNLIVMNLVLLILMIPIYLYLKSINFKNIFLYLILLFLVAGGIASTIDRVIWGGSLDFILIYNYIIDFKDIYLFLSIFISIIYTIKGLFCLIFNSKKSYRL